MTEPALVADLRAAVSGPVHAAVPLASYTTLRVGGPAAALVQAESHEDLRQVARVCADRQVPWLVVGRGSNLLVGDEGWPGVALLLGKAFRGVTVEGADVEVGGAEPMPALARAVARHHLGGLAFGVAIPGTVGGAVRMNAGAHDGETRQVLVWAEVARLDRGGALERIATADLRMGYRTTALPPDAVVVRARFALEPMEPARLQAEMAELRRWRRANQPINEPSCGSVFANPPGDSAGRLIEEAGGKEIRRGGARISEAHANFITVEPGATAADVYAVAAAAQQRVASVHGIVLRPEVVIVGFPPLAAATPGRERPG